MSKLDHYEHLFEWLKIREASGISFPSSLDQLKISMAKSALLDRLFKGKEIFSIPPPKRYSYPWYSLIENGEDISNDVWKANSWVEQLYAHPTVMICQFPWIILKELGPEEWFASYEYDLHGQSKLCENTWHVSKIDDYWTIKKLNA